MKKMLAFIDATPPSLLALVSAIVLCLLTITAHAQDKPLVLESGQIKVLPANKTVIFNASTSGNAPLNIGQGTAPSSPNNGDCWITSAALSCRVNGSTVAYGSITSAALDAAFGSTRGAILERSASGWVVLPPSATAGLALASNGTGADPSYQSVAPADVTAAAAAVLMRNFGGL